MKIFFRKHGNSLLYICLPVLFLVLTVAFIQFTPRASQTALNDSCVDDDQCCTTSGCGPQEISEICVDETCKRINVGCDEGDVSDTDAGCVCLNDDGEIIGQCVVCDLGEVFIEETFGEPECRPVCGPNEDPDIRNCVPVGAFLEGDGIGCSLSHVASSASALPSALMGLGLVGAAWATRRRKR